MWTDFLLVGIHLPSPLFAKPNQNALVVTVIGWMDDDDDDDEDDDESSLQNTYGNKMCIQKKCTVCFS